jgi:CheY-like chemotaxis protein
MKQSNTTDVATAYRKVMIVEDDRELRQLLQLTIDLRLDVRVVIATDGFMAMMMARGELPDLILMDLSMPYVDGFTAIELIKADARTKHIPIMAFSNHGWNFDWQQKAIELGCVRCLQKSECMTHLVDIIKEFFEETP